MLFTVGTKVDAKGPPLMRDQRQVEEYSFITP
jgi:hypothetical protein